MKIRVTSKKLTAAQEDARRKLAKLEFERQYQDTELLSVANPVAYLAGEGRSRLQTLSVSAVESSERLAILRDQIDTPLEAALKSVNGTAKAHTITSALDVRSVAARAENELLERGSRKGSLPNTLVWYRPEAPQQAAYKYAAKSTEIELTRTSGGWFLTGVRTINIWPGKKESFQYTVPCIVQEDILRAALADIRVHYYIRPPRGFQLFKCTATKG